MYTETKWAASTNLIFTNIEKSAFEMVMRMLDNEVKAMNAPAKNKATYEARAAEWGRLAAARTALISA